MATQDTAPERQAAKNDSVLANYKTMVYGSYSLPKYNLSTIFLTPVPRRDLPYSFDAQSAEEMGRIVGKQTRDTRVDVLDLLTDITHK